MVTVNDDEEITDPEGDSSTKTYLKSGAGVLYALLYTSLSAFSAQFMALSSQAGIPGLQLNFINKFGQLLLVLVVLPVFKPKLTAEDGRQTLYFILWTITDNLGAVLGFMSFVFVVPGIAFGIIRGSMPFLTACLGFLLLKETMGVVDCFGIVLSVSGVAVAVGMIMENTSSTQRLTTSILLPLASAFSKGPNTVIARSLVGVQGVSILTIIFYANLLGAVVLLPLTYIVETGQRWEMSAQTAGYVIELCLCDYGASFATKLALKTEKAGITATIKTFTIPTSVFLDYVIQSPEFPSPVKLGGIILIVVGTTVAAGYTWWRHRKDILHKKVIGETIFW